MPTEYTPRLCSPSLRAQPSQRSRECVVSVAVAVSGVDTRAEVAPPLRLQLHRLEDDALMALGARLSAAIYARASRVVIPRVLYVSEVSMPDTKS